MATPTIPNGEEYFFPILYEGDGGGQRVGKFVPFTDNGTIDNSCIFNRGDNPKLSRLPSSNGNRRTLTYSVWIKRGILGTENHFISCYDGSSTDNESMWEMQFLTDNTVSISRYSDYILQTTRTFEDTSKWYHFLMAIDTTQGTASNRVKLYVDGDEITAFDVDNRSSISQNFDTAFNNTSDTCVIGARINTTNRHWSGYMAEVNLVDGTALTPSTFGLTDTSTGRWIPKTLSGITYGTNGFRLKFQDSSALGDDTSGNGNDLTATNLASTDQTTDSPSSNFATFSPNFSSSTMGLTEGNLTVTDNGGTSWETAFVGKPVQSGKWYFEATVDVAGLYDTFFGVNTLDSLATNKAQYTGYADGSAGFAPTTAGGGDVVYHGNNGNNYYYPGASTSFSNGDIAGIAYDADTGAYWMAKNNTWISSGNPSTGANPIFSGYTAGKLVYFGLSNLNNGTKHSVNFGQRSFTYTPPTGFKALQQDNMPTTDKGVSGFVWMKVRDAVGSHHSNDSSNGAFNRLVPNLTNAMAFRNGSLSKFLKGGQAIGDNTAINNLGNSYVSWNWVANGGTTASNGNGSITSTVQANTTAGFSIVQYSGNSGSAGTIGHGLSAKPEWIIVKDLDASVYAWMVYHKSSGATKYLQLNATDGESTLSTIWNNTEPTNSVFSIGTNGSVNSGTNNYIAYVWHSVDGFSKFEKYTGNGSTDGTFVYTGFAPRFLIIKRINTTGGWFMWDTERQRFNPNGTYLEAQRDSAEDVQNSTVYIDFVSNGFKIRGTSSALNTSSSTYAYMAFAEHPFVGDGTSPVTAR